MQKNAEQLNYKIVFNLKNILGLALFVLVIVSFLIGYLLKVPKKSDNIETSMLPTNNDQQRLVKEDIVVGTGSVAEKGKTVKVNYLGTLEDGKKFDSSYDRGQPFEFELGAGDVIPGWDLGVDGMKVGGKRRLIIAPELAYGESGAGSSIPPNSTLIFEIELLEVK